MKSIKYIAVLMFGAILLYACEKKDYPAGLPEYEHHYYAVYVPNNNAIVTTKRTDAALLKFPVQFYSTHTRSYDAVAWYGVGANGLTERVNNRDTTWPKAVEGVDFQIVDRNGTAVTGDAAGNRSLIFPKAIQATDTIYVKILNNGVPGTRAAIIEIRENKNDQFYVDKFSTASLRPIKIN